MDENGGNGLFGFVVGGVVVVAAILAFVIYGGEGTGRKMVNLDLPPLEAPADR
jgi:hypothetical protein